MNSPARRLPLTRERVFSECQRAGYGSAHPKHVPPIAELDTALDVGDRPFGGWGSAWVECRILKSLARKVGDRFTQDEMVRALDVAWSHLETDWVEERLEGGHAVRLGDAVRRGTGRARNYLWRRVAREDPTWGPRRVEVSALRTDETWWGNPEQATIRQLEAEHDSGKRWVEGQMLQARRDLPHLERLVLEARDRPSPEPRPAIVARLNALYPEMELTERRVERAEERARTRLAVRRSELEDQWRLTPGYRYGRP